MLNLGKILFDGGLFVIIGSAIALGMMWLKYPYCEFA